MKTGYEVAQIKRRVRKDERQKVIAEVLEIIDSEISGWERVREELGQSPEDDNVEAGLAVVRSLVERLKEGKE